MKNFASIYASGNDSSALEQRFFIKEEVSRGTVIAPTGADFIYTLNGGAVLFGRPANTSPVRSGRHHSTVIEEKDTVSWSFPTFFMVDESLGAASSAQIDPAMRVLLKSLLGREQTGPLTYDTVTAPNTTFTIFENHDSWANQAAGCFAEAGSMQLPGDGQAQTAWNGFGKEVLRAGIGKSVTANAANAITLAAGEGARFEIGTLVMVIKSNGTTRSTDTPDGSPRKVTNVVGDVVTVDGGVLTDSNGTVNPVYLSYYEPTTPVAINNPLTGLVGTITVAGLTVGGVRNLTLDLANNHELINYYFGERSLAGALFNPGSRFTAGVSFEVNMNAKVLEYIKGLKSFDGMAVNAVLGSATGRRVAFNLPKVVVSIPEIPTPDEGSVPVTFAGTAYQTAEDAADEIEIEML